MQPYFFPYIGYFQLVNAVDHFVFYDDVDFIKQGWINRNKILINKQETLITIPCKGVSSNKRINEIQLTNNTKYFKKLIKSIQQSYIKAPFFNDVFPLVEDVLLTDYEGIGQLASDSIKKVSHYLGFKTEFYSSTKSFSNTIELDRADRLISITKKLGCSNYINSTSGQKLYDKSYFIEHDVELAFLSPNLPKYKQFNDQFIQGLSMVDVLMFNEKRTVLEMINDYEIV